MSKKSFIDSVKVKDPCTEDWEQMHGNDRVRFCSHCSKHVNNLSEMTRKEAMRLVRSSGGNLCIRYIQNPVTKRPMFAEQLLQITRRAPGLAAGVMTASMALSTHAWAQESSPTDTPVVIEQKIVEPATAKVDTKEITEFGSISGVVRDQNGAVIPGIQIELTNKLNNEKRATQSYADGNYKFDDLPEGDYELVFKAGLGFQEYGNNGLSVQGGKETIQNAEMIVSGIVVNGGAFIIEETEYKTPLVIAVRNEDVDGVRELITNGANVNGKEEDKTTPLFAAVESGDIEIVQLLLEQGAKVNARDKEKQTPIMRLDDDATPELVELLIRYGAKVNLTDKQRNTALIMATLSATSDVIRALIDAGADVRVANKAGRTALMNAAYDDNVANVRLLIEAGADVNAKDSDGDTAWDKADDSEIRELLVSHGAVVVEQTETETNDVSEPPA